MKTISAIALMTLIMSSTFAQAAAPSETQPKLGLWERFCVENKIGDACGKAIKSLTQRIIDAKYQDVTGLQERLKTVAALGCQLHDKSSCLRMKDTTIATLAVEQETAENESDEVE